MSVFHHPECAHFKEDDKGEFLCPRPACDCADLPADDLKPELGDVITTIAPRRHFSPIEVEAEILRCCATGSYQVKVLSGDIDLEGKQLLVPAGRALLLRRAG